jgi:hypothetical protein
MVVLTVATAEDVIAAAGIDHQLLEVVAVGGDLLTQRG